MSNTTQTLLRQARAHRGLPAAAECRSIRVGSGLSQKALAGALGVTREAVAKWEAGQRRPRGALLTAYAELLGRLQRGSE